MSPTQYRKRDVDGWAWVSDQRVISAAQLSVLLRPEDPLELRGTQRVASRWVQSGMLLRGAVHPTEGRLYHASSKCRHSYGGRPAPGAGILEHALSAGWVRLQVESSVCKWIPEHELGERFGLRGSQDHWADAYTVSPGGHLTAIEVERNVKARGRLEKILRFNLSRADSVRYFVRNESVGAAVSRVRDERLGREDAARISVERIQTVEDYRLNPLVLLMNGEGL